MSMFPLAISCLTSSNLPWFMDLTFQVPMQYCCLQYQTLLPSPVTFQTECYFCFGYIPSFFLKLFLHWSPVAILGTYRPGEFIFQCPIFLPFHTIHGVLKAILKWFAIPFSAAASGPHFVPSPVDHILSIFSKSTEMVCHSFLHHDSSILGGPTWHGS